MQREVEELRAQIAKKEEEEGEEQPDGPGEGVDRRKGVEELAEALKTLTTEDKDGAQKRLAKRVAESMGAVGEVEKPLPSEKAKAEVN